MSISQAEQKAAVTFLPDTRVFSAAEFRGAVAEADVDVVTFEMEVCGVVDGEDTIRAAIDASPRLRIIGEHRDSGARLCAAGRLDESVIPHRLHVLVGRPPG